MAYAVIADIQKILKDQFYDFGTEIDDEVEFAEAVVDSQLGGIYDLKFDDTANYASVPVAIKWITSLLTAWRLFDKMTVLEGRVDATAADRWKEKAMD